MKWKTVKPEPMEGDARTVRRFAFLPKECEGGMTVWLETYDSFQVYKRVLKYEGKHHAWFEEEWVETKAYYLEIYV